MKQAALLYLLVNLFSFLLFGIDKYKARREKWRIKENTLLFASFLGIFGGLSGMYLFHHKTKKRKFQILLPLFLILELLLFCLYSQKTL